MGAVPFIDKKTTGEPDCGGGVMDRGPQGKPAPAPKGAGKAVAPFADIANGKTEQPDKVYRG
jgi:hypothetical protein